MVDGIVASGRSRDVDWCEGIRAAAGSAVGAERLLYGGVVVAGWAVVTRRKAVGCRVLEPDICGPVLRTRREARELAEWACMALPRKRVFVVDVVSIGLARWHVLKCEAVGLG